MFQAANGSSYTSFTVIVNGTVDEFESSNIPTGVKTSPISYPYPKFVILKSITLEPCPTTTSTDAPIPEVLPLKGKLLYGIGESNSTDGGVLLS